MYENITFSFLLSLVFQTLLTRHFFRIIRISLTQKIDSKILEGSVVNAHRQTAVLSFKSDDMNKQYSPNHMSSALRSPAQKLPFQFLCCLFGHRHSCHLEVGGGTGGGRRRRRRRRLCRLHRGGVRRRGLYNFFGLF